MSNRTLLVDRLSAALGSTKVDADGILKVFSTVLQDHLVELRMQSFPALVV